VDLEQIVEDLRNEMVFRDEEFKEMRDELESLKAENEKLQRKLKEEKMNRQNIEAHYVK
jgi:chromatin segregation and condensation protein Rec8/ScpA/Scc1 (kleisin family)